jgi:hypothetical protein
MVSYDNTVCQCICHQRYGDKAFCRRCLDKHKASPYYNVMKKFD